MTNKFFSSNFSNGNKTAFQQQPGFSPNVNSRYNNQGNKQRGQSPGKRNNMNTNAYEYRSNPASKLVNNPEMRNSQSNDSQSFNKRNQKSIKDPNSATPFVPKEFQNQTFDVNGESARKSNIGRESIGGLSV